MAAIGKSRKPTIRLVSARTGLWWLGMIFNCTPICAGIFALPLDVNFQKVIRVECSQEFSSNASPRGRSDGAEACDSSPRKIQPSREQNRKRRGANVGAGLSVLS